MIVRDDEKVKKTIAENIVRYRRECNLTQAELAEKSTIRINPSPNGRERTVFPIFLFLSCLRNCSA